MAYENGRRIHSYFNKQKGKRKQRNLASSKYSWWIASSDKPWKRWYISGVRKYAKAQTNRRLRAMKFRYLKSPSEYRKVFDYDWTIW